MVEPGGLLACFNKTKSAEKHSGKGLKGKSVWPCFEATGIIGGTIGGGGSNDIHCQCMALLFGAVRRVKMDDTSEKIGEHIGHQNG